MCQANVCETALLQGQRILISHTVYKTLIHPLCSSSHIMREWLHISMQLEKWVFGITQTI